MTGPLATQAAVPADWLTRFSQAIGRHIPDAMSTAVGMLLLLAVGALAIGNSGAAVMDAFYRGLWMLLPFTMQMALILVLSSTLGEAPVFRRAISRLSRLPRTRAQVFALSCLVIACLAYLYWGLAMALGPLVAVYFAREAERKGIAVDFPFLLATTGSAQAIWQFGLSASAPLLMNTPGHFLEKQTGLMPLSTTIWAPASLGLHCDVPAGNPCRGAVPAPEPSAVALPIPRRVRACRAAPRDCRSGTDRPCRAASDPVGPGRAELGTGGDPGHRTGCLGLLPFSCQAPRAGSQLAQHRALWPGAARAPERRQLQPGASDGDPLLLADRRDVPPLRRGGRPAPIHDARRHDRWAAGDGGHAAHLPVLHGADFDRGGLLRSLERRSMGHSGLCDRHGRRLRSARRSNKAFWRCRSATRWGIC